jgi:ribosomal protein S18 acetylase RimI-like enzyme
MSIGCRSMRPGEEEVVAVLIRQMAKDLGHGDFVPKLTGQSLREASDITHVMVAEDAGLILGVCVWIMTYSTWRGAKGVYICDLFVLEHARGRQVGEKLLRSTLVEAQKLGSSFVKMEVETVNTRAQDFYRRLGFTQKVEDQFFILEPEAFSALVKGVER